jgi:enoyl-CoA hydratase/carnithine racemase
MTAAAAKSSEPDSPLLLEDMLEDGIVQLTMNRPDTLNALSTDMIAALHAGFDRMAERRDVRVIVLAANGRAFAPGHDLKELRANKNPAFYTELMARCCAMMMRIQSLPQPVIAKVHAMAYAAGCQLVASADLAIASETAVFCTPGVNIGLFCSTPMVALSRNVGAKQSMEMLLTGDPISAATAAEWGLINRAVPAADLDQAVLELARKIGTRSPGAISIGKEAFYRQHEMPTADAYAYASEIMLRNILMKDADEGIDAFIQKRSPEWPGR